MKTSCFATNKTSAPVVSNHRGDFGQSEINHKCKFQFIEQVRTTQIVGDVPWTSRLSWLRNIFQNAEGGVPY